MPKIDRWATKLHACIKPYNRSPMLLPTRNFRHDALICALSDCYLTDESDLGGIPDSLFDKYVTNFKSKRTRRSKKTIYTDSSGRNFQSSGKADHGSLRPGATADPECERADCRFFGKVRLGSTFPVGFHFDCTDSGGRTCSGNFANCHGERSYFRSNKNLNIFPNDRVRDVGKIVRTSTVCRK